jgi:hypothetical protein
MKIWMLAFFHCLEWVGPISVAALSKARTVFACSNTEIVGSNPIGDMDVCVVLCVRSGLVTDWSPSKETYELCIGLGKLKNEARANQKRAVQPNAETLGYST